MGKRAFIAFLKSEKGGVRCLSCLRRLSWIYLTGRIGLQWEDLYRTGDNGNAAPSPIVRAVIALLRLFWCEGILLFDFWILHLASGRVGFRIFCS